MFSISIFEILFFLRQLGFALAGASCLWGIYFYIKSKKTKREKSEVLRETSGKMFGPLSLGVFLAFLNWIGFNIFYPALVLAHEGISLTINAKEVFVSMQNLSMFFYLFFGVYLAGALWRKFSPDSFSKNISIFYGLELILASIIISIPVWFEGLPTYQQIFHIGHSFHSILTIGTVLVLDFVFILTKYSETFEKHLYGLLSSFSNVIWFGLAIDFISVLFIFHEAISFSSKFIFMQTVIAVIIINGILLSGPITEKLLSVVKDKEIKKLSPSWDRFMTVSGSVSVVSWLTITFTDVIQEVSLSYPLLLAIYVLIIIIAYVVYEILEHYKVGARWS